MQHINAFSAHTRTYACELVHYTAVLRLSYARQETCAYQGRTMAWGGGEWGRGQKTQPETQVPEGTVYKCEIYFECIIIIDDLLSADEVYPIRLNF